MRDKFKHKSKLRELIMTFSNRDDFNIWYIADFYKHVLESLGLQHPNDSISLHRNTLANWFRYLEKNEIHYVYRDRFQKKVYTDLDLQIACYIYNETKYKRSSIGNICAFGFKDLETRSFIEAKKDIVAIKSVEKEHKVLSPTRQVNGENLVTGGKVSSIELLDALKNDVTYNGYPLTIREKQRVMDFLSGLIWPSSILDKEK
jgi:hypothetical protein